MQENYSVTTLDDHWHLAVSVDKVQQDEPVAVTLGVHKIALYSIDGKLFATDAICTHAHACLAEGYQEGDIIECPLHEGRFHIPTGKALGPPVSENLKTFPIKVVSGQVYVEVIG